MNTTQVIHFPCQIATWVVFSRQIATLSQIALYSLSFSLFLSTLHPPSNSATIMQKTTHYPPMHIHPNITEYILNIANSQYPNLTAYFSLCLCCPSNHIYTFAHLHICTFASPLFSATIMCEQLDAEVHIYISPQYHTIISQHLNITISSFSPHTRLVFTLWGKYFPLEEKSGKRFSQIQIRPKNSFGENSSSQRHCVFPKIWINIFKKLISWIWYHHCVVKSPIMMEIKMAVVVVLLVVRWLCTNRGGFLPLYFIFPPFIFRFFNFILPPFIFYILYFIFYISYLNTFLTMTTTWGEDSNKTSYQALKTF